MQFNFSFISFKRIKEKEKQENSPNLQLTSVVILNLCAVAHWCAVRDH